MLIVSIDASKRKKTHLCNNTFEGDDKQSFADFAPFGGWSKPFVSGILNFAIPITFQPKKIPKKFLQKKAKQYSGDTKLCDEDVDLDWRP